MQINSISDFRKAMRNGPYAWPGGYPLFFVMGDRINTDNLKNIWNTA